MCVCKGGASPSLYRSVEGDPRGNFPEPTPAPSSTPSMQSVGARRAEEVLQGAGPRPGRARAWASPPRAHPHVAAYPLGLEHHGMVGSAWFGPGLACCSSFATLCIPESALLTLFQCFQLLFL
jgi:hypothetical protein